MLLHMFMHSYNAAEETYMTELIDLIVANGLYGHMLFNICQVSR